DPDNFIAANELGVMLVRLGRLSDSRIALEHAVATSDAPTAWQNLAMVCDRLGDPNHAALARKDADTARAKLQKSGYTTAGMKYPVQWIDQESFARTNSMTIAAQYGADSSVSSIPQNSSQAAAGQVQQAGATQSVLRQPSTTATKPETRGSF